MLDIIARLLSDIKTILQNQWSEGGHTEGTQIVLPVNGPTTELYFTSRHGPNVNVPVGTLLLLPAKPFKTLILLNEGNGDIMFEVNALEGQAKLGSILRAQEDRQIESNKQCIFSLFLRAVPAGGPNPSVNATNWNSDATTAHIRIETIS